MAQAFTPFLPSSAARAACPATSNAAFQAMGHSSEPARTANEASQPSASGEASPAPHPEPHAGHEPKMTLQREGDRITHIQITCKCGEVLEIDCTYSD
jgi:hypothetical protein